MPTPPLSSWRCRLTDMVLTCNLKFPNFLWGFMSPASRGGSSHLKKKDASQLTLMKKGRCIFKIRKIFYDERNGSFLTYTAAPERVEKCGWCEPCFLGNQRCPESLQDPEGRREWRQRSCRNDRSPRGPKGPRDSFDSSEISGGHRSYFSTRKVQRGSSKCTFLNFG